MGADEEPLQIDGGKVLLDHINIVTDSATSSVTGETDLTRWPEQIYSVKSTVDFPRMKEIFFARDRFSRDWDRPVPAPSTCSRAGASCAGALRASKRE